MTTNTSKKNFLYECICSKFVLEWEGSGPKSGCFWEKSWEPLVEGVLGAYALSVIIRKWKRQMFLSYRPD